VDEARLDLALAFLNSRDESRDMLASARRAARWLAGDAFVGIDKELSRLLPAMRELSANSELTEAEVEAAREVRDAILGWIDGRPPASTALERASLRVTLDAAGPALHPASTGIFALAEHALLVMYELQIAGLADRLRRCQSHDCRWVFFDRSRNRSKVWCDMSGCGSRAKARAYRARRAERPISRTGPGD
jgi:predicted RNA-binding Zn ribbon-like protein